MKIVEGESTSSEMDLRLSCPPRSVRPVSRYTPLTDRSEDNKPEKSVGGTWSVIQSQSNRLNGLYEKSKNRNYRLLQLSLDLSRDLNFLKEYCKCLEMELEKIGFYKETSFERLSRRQTAASIFDSYSGTSSLLSDWSQEQNNDEELIRLRKRNSNLEQQNKQLHQKVNNQSCLRLSKSIQVDTVDMEKTKRQYQMAQERIAQLTAEVGKLKYANGALQFEKRKRGLQANLLQGGQQIFKRIHEIMGDCRRKMNALAHEKKDVEKRYRVLRDNVRFTETGNQLKLIDLLTEKIDILEKLVEKQQVEIQNTIGVYEAELKKIEDKRKQQIQVFENERIGLQSENLKLCIDVQKALNRQDSTNILLLQERNMTERLNFQMNKLSQQMKKNEAKQKQNKSFKLKIDSGVSKFYGDNFQSAHKVVQSHIIQSVHSAEYRYSNNDQNSNRSNIQYQYSEMEQSRQYRDQNGVDSPGRQGYSRNPMDKIKITYQSIVPSLPYGAGVHLSHHSNPTPTRGYEAALEYKRRFVDRKLETSYNR